MDAHTRNREPRSPPMHTPSPETRPGKQEPQQGAHVMNVRGAEAPPQVPSLGGQRFLDRDRLQRSK